MKRKLTTTALLFSLCNAPVYAEAKAPELKIGGYTVVEGMTAFQKNKEKKRSGQPHIVIGGSDLFFTVIGKSEKGFEYKYRLNFESNPGASFYINRNYVEFTDAFGVIQLGNVDGPEGTMPESGADLIGGAAGIDGGMNSVYNFSSGVISGVNYIGMTKRAAKAVWYTPTVFGFQFGIAYTPNTSNIGNDSKDNTALGSLEKGNSSAIYSDKTKQPFGTGNLTMGLGYTKSFDKWSVALALVGMKEKTKYSNAGIYTPMRSGNSYQASAAIGYDVWRVAAGWIDNRKSRLPKNGSLLTYVGNAHLGNAGKAWNLGGSYTFGSYQFATTYHRTDRKTDAVNKANSDIVCLSADLNALQGLKFFGEVDWIKTRTNNPAVAVAQGNLKQGKAIGNNSGTVCIIGTKVSF